MSSNKKPAERSGYSIEKMAELYGVNPWTIRMWVDRFDIPTYRMDGTIRFTPENAERIGEICRLVKTEGVTLKDVREHLGSGNDRRQKKDE